MLHMQGHIFKFDAYSGSELANYCYRTIDWINKYFTKQVRKNEQKITVPYLTREYYKSLMLH